MARLPCLATAITDLTLNRSIFACPYIWRFMTFERVDLAVDLTARLRRRDRGGHRLVGFDACGEPSEHGLRRHGDPRIEPLLLLRAHHGMESIQSLACRDKS